MLKKNGRRITDPFLLGSSNNLFLVGGIKQCKCMVKLLDLLENTVNTRVLRRFLHQIHPLHSDPETFETTGLPFCVASWVLWELKCHQGHLANLLIVETSESLDLMLGLLKVTHMECHGPGNSANVPIFGMVSSRDPFKGCW